MQCMLTCTDDVIGQVGHAVILFGFFTFLYFLNVFCFRERGGDCLLHREAIAMIMA